VIACGAFYLALFAGLWDHASHLCLSFGRSILSDDGIRIDLWFSGISQGTHVLLQKALRSEVRWMCKRADAGHSDRGLSSPAPSAAVVHARLTSLNPQHNEASLRPRIWEPATVPLYGQQVIVLESRPDLATPGRFRRLSRHVDGCWILRSENIPSQLVSSSGRAPPGSADCSHRAGLFGPVRKPGASR